jgi:tetratricopeptide (TPR) repeat protein
VCLLLLLSCTSRVREAQRGQQLYEQGKYLEAYEAYQAVLRQQGGPEVRFNAGNALYRLKQYSEASKSWRDATSGADSTLREEAYFNMGNAFVRASEDANALSGYLERSLDAYEEALRLNPNDRDAKWNLEIALQRYGDPGQAGSRGRGGRADYGAGSREEGYEGNRETAVGAMAGGGSGGDEGESVEEMDPEQARSLLEAVERQQLSTHEGKRPRSTAGADRDW